jgi:hypothetical protein
MFGSEEILAFIRRSVGVRGDAPIPPGVCIQSQKIK